MKYLLILLFLATPLLTQTFTVISTSKDAFIIDQGHNMPLKKGFKVIQSDSLIGTYKLLTQSGKIITSNKPTQIPNTSVAGQIATITTQTTIKTYIPTTAGATRSLDNPDKFKPEVTIKYPVFHWISPILALSEKAPEFELMILSTDLDLIKHIKTTDTTYTYNALLPNTTYICLVKYKNNLSKYQEFKTK